MSKESLAIIGAGLTGSLLAARLRDRHAVTVVEQGDRPRPLLDEIACEAGGINSSINRGQGLGGTTAYWHNALIELDPGELRACGLDPDEMASWYARGWRLFLDEERLALSEQIRAGNLGAYPDTTAELAHMVVPHARANMWSLANARFPGAPITVRRGRAERIAADPAGGWTITLQGDNAGETIHADRVIVAAGGLGTPALLARSVDRFGQVNGGYHDHPMTYVAKIRLRPGSRLPAVSCQDTAGLSIRSGFTYRHDGLKTAIYLRPALGLGLRSITGEARYILSDLRNDPFSPRKIFRLLTNPEAIREGLLFKSGAGFTGRDYSLLLLGEQHGEEWRGVEVRRGERPRLNWQVTPREQEAYRRAVEAFLGEFADEITEARQVPAADWGFRTAAHHSGGLAAFGQRDDDLHAVDALPGLLVCDGSMLRAGGIANSGLTLVALTLRLADRLDGRSAPVTVQRDVIGGG